MLHMICIRLHHGHMSVRVGDSLQRSEEIVKNLKLCFSVRSLLLFSVCGEKVLYFSCEEGIKEESMYTPLRISLEVSYMFGDWLQRGSSLSQTT